MPGALSSTVASWLVKSSSRTDTHKPNGGSLACEKVLASYGGENMFGFLGFIVFGLVAGAIARTLVLRRDPCGSIAVLLIGVAGAVVGGWLGQVSGFSEYIRPGGMLTAVIGSVSLLGGYRLLSCDSS